MWTRTRRVLARFFGADVERTPDGTGTTAEAEAEAEAEAGCADRRGLHDLRGLRTVSLLGRGGFGSVYVAELPGARERVAVKQVRRARLSADDAALLEVERAVWAALDHPNVMPLLGVRVTAQHAFFATELMDGSLADVHERMRRTGARPRVRTIANGLVQVARGMEYLHALEPAVLHRDLKSANVLVKGHVWKVADFGLARFLGPTMTAETGSYRWMAPEVIRHEPYGRAADVFSFGMLTYECLTLSVPYVGLSPVEAAFAVARDGRRPPLPPCSEPVEAFVAACWQQDAALRPAFATVVERLEALQQTSESFGASAMAARETARAPPQRSVSFGARTA